MQVQEQWHDYKGIEYAEIISEFDLARYEISQWETIYETEQFCQVDYVIETHVKNPDNADLEGAFHVTSSWHKSDEGWKLVFIGHLLYGIHKSIS